MHQDMLVMAIGDRNPASGGHIVGLEGIGPIVGHEDVEESSAGEMALTGTGDTRHGRYVLPSIEMCIIDLRRMQRHARGVVATGNNDHG